MSAGPDRLKGRRCVGDVRILSLNFKLQELNGSDFNGSTLKVQAGKPKRCANPALKYYENHHAVCLQSKGCGCQRQASHFGGGPGRLHFEHRQAKFLQSVRKRKDWYICAAFS